MQLVFKLLITEVISVFIGLILVAGNDEDAWLGFVGAVLFFVSVFALVVTGLWWVWSL